MVGDQELDIEGGVNADPLPGLWDVQGVGRGSDFLQHFEGSVAKIFQLLHLPGGAQIFHIEKHHVSDFEFWCIPLRAVVLFLHFLCRHL